MPIPFHVGVNHRHPHFFLNVLVELFTVVPLEVVPCTYQVTVVPEGMNHCHKTAVRVVEVELPE